MIDREILLIMIDNQPLQVYHNHRTRQFMNDRAFFAPKTKYVLCEVVQLLALRLRGHELVWFSMAAPFCITKGTRQMLEQYLKEKLTTIPPPPFKPEFMWDQITSIASNLEGRKLYLLMACAMAMIALHLEEEERPHA